MGLVFAQLFGRREDVNAHVAHFQLKAAFLGEFPLRFSSAMHGGGARVGGRRRLLRVTFLESVQFEKDLQSHAKKSLGLNKSTINKSGFIYCFSFKILSHPIYEV